jgi:hypothetical protein
VLAWAARRCSWRTTASRSVGTYLHQRVGGGVCGLGRLRERAQVGYWTGPRCGSTTPTPTACVLDFCDRLGKPARGHCVFWAVDGVMQQWIRTSAATGTSSCTPGSFLSTLTQVGPAWLCLPTLRQMGPVLYVRDTCRWKGVVVVHSLTGGVGVAHLMTARHDRTKKMK